MNRSHAILAACTLLFAPAALAQPTVNLPPLTGEMAVATRWQSRVKLGHDMATISAKPFTLSARFFPQHRVPHFGAVIGMAISDASRERFAIGQSLITNKDPSWAKPAVGLFIGATETTFDAETKLLLNQWNHLAVVFVPTQGWTVYLNGAKIGSAPDNGFRAKGELSIGRINENAKSSQFYGLIDDVAVFDVALSARDIAHHAALKALVGTEAGLKWGWRFNGNAETMNAQSKPPVIEGNARKVPVSVERNPNDLKNMPAPVQVAKYTLPFPEDAEYYVVQGNCGNGHHWGNYAFTWDFIYAGSRNDSLPLRQANGNVGATEKFNILKGQGQTIVAIADGTVVHANWEFVEGDGSKVPNATIVRHGPAEYSAYYHLQKGSFPAQFPWASPKQPFTTSLAAFGAIDAGTLPASYPKVSAHKPVGGEGGTGMEACPNCYHLHFGVLDQLDLFHYNSRISRPIHFLPFESSSDRITWKTVSGVPEAKTFIRRKL
jgi:hypothetical protein